MSKRVVAVLIAVSILITLNISSLAVSSKQWPSIELNGKVIKASAYTEKGILYLPLRTVCEALGYKVSWSKKGNTVAVKKTDKSIFINLSNDMVTKGDYNYYLEGNFNGRSAENKIFAKNTTFMSASFFYENFAIKANWDVQNNVVRLTSFSENPILIKTIKETSNNSKIKITLQYPQIEGLDNLSMQNGMNSILKRAARDARDEGIKNAEDLARDPAYPGTPNKCETYFDYRVKYNQDGIISIILRNYQYSGGAHGITVQTSHTFNLKTGYEYRLKDFFKNSTDYVSFISSKIRSEIDKRVKEGVLFELINTTFKAIKEDQDYYLTGEGVMVYFQQYEYFPYVAGIQAFNIGFTELKDMLRSDFYFMNDDYKILKPSGTKNTLNIDEIGRVNLKGNPTTGYTWHYSIVDSSILGLVSEIEFHDSSLIGSGSTFIWDFKALKSGQTKIIFKYYRDWEGEASVTPENTIEYLVDVPV